MICFQCHFYHPLFQLDQNIKRLCHLQQIAATISCLILRMKLREDKIIITLGHFRKISDYAIWELLPIHEYVQFLRTL